MTYNISAAQLTAIIVIVIWDILWKGVALWRAAHRDEQLWFICLLAVNSAGILPIIYILSTNMSEKTSNTERAEIANGAGEKS